MDIFKNIFKIFIWETKNNVEKIINKGKNISVDKRLNIFTLSIFLFQCNSSKYITVYLRNWQSYFKMY